MSLPSSKNWLPFCQLVLVLIAADFQLTCTFHLATRIRKRKASSLDSLRAMYRPCRFLAATTLILLEYSGNYSIIKQVITNFLTSCEATIEAYQSCRGFISLSKRKGRGGISRPRTIITNILFLLLFAILLALTFHPCLPIPLELGFRYFSAAITSSLTVQLIYSLLSLHRYRINPGLGKKWTSARIAYAWNSLRAVIFVVIFAGLCGSVSKPSFWVLTSMLFMLVCIPTSNLIPSWRMLNPQEHGISSMALEATIDIRKANEKGGCDNSSMLGLGPDGAGGGAHMKGIGLSVHSSAIEGGTASDDLPSQGLTNVDFAITAVYK